jgi:phosphate transport system protein
MEQDHIVKSFDDDLGQIDAIIAEMGGLAERQLADAVEALVRRDIELAQQVINGDKRIDELESTIDNLTIRVLALRQPMAEDLRMVIVALKMAANLERIGDYAKNVAKRTLILAAMDPVGNATQSVQRMAFQVQAMIKNVLDAYGARDIGKADDVRLRDEEVDLMHTSLFRELLTYMMEDPRNITACTHLLFIAKNVERIGDHVTSIAEYVHFLVAGDLPADERPKGDLSSQTMLEKI